ncbi:MAG: enoyl-CoA hydratase family protein [Planctomycetota bacterium]|nr:enoyl-CoA hydratase family protein [Planctomycetota bacterium]MSR39516.1 enoyl-CoA hydratase family protein [Planctomycetota bacterium]
MSDFDFRFERGADGVAVLTFDRPDSLNSLTFTIYRQLEQLFLELENDDAVRCIVLTGKGRGFCSGGSVEDIIGPLLESELDKTLAFTRMTGAVVRNMLRLSKPIIAAINGVAAGAGAVLALASDLRLMSETAKFAFLFTKVGLTGADMGAAWLLPKVIGSGRAMELLLLGDKVDAAECHRIGLANRVLPADLLLPEAMAIARRLANGPCLAQAMTKKLLWAEWPMDLDAAIEQEAQAQALLLRAQDHREFYLSWMEQRDPRFLGR